MVSIISTGDFDFLLVSNLCSFIKKRKKTLYYSCRLFAKPANDINHTGPRNIDEHLTIFTKVMQLHDNNWIARLGNATSSVKLERGVLLSC